MNRPFTLDRANGKLMGVCAGTAAATGADVTLIRLAAVALALIAGPLAILFYLLAGLIAPNAG
jgi:phage shock protein PspC (stress-responsive transcriptional regulator)